MSTLLTHALNPSKCTYLVYYFCFVFTFHTEAKPSNCEYFCSILILPSSALRCTEHMYRMFFLYYMYFLFHVLHKCYSNHSAYMSLFFFIFFNITLIQNCKSFIYTIEQLRAFREKNRCLLNRLRQRDIVRSGVTDISFLKSLSPDTLHRTSYFLKSVYRGVCCDLGIFQIVYTALSVTSFFFLKQICFF